MHSATATATRAALAAAETGGVGLAHTRLRRLQARPRQPGQASMFWHEPRFNNAAVKVLPGEYFVDDEDILIMTTLGSCIAVCLWDREARIGGMNHFMLPEGDGTDGPLASGRYGSYAMELLINAMQKRGAQRITMEAKVFGGGQVVTGMDTLNIGEHNTAFVLDYLKTERITVVSKDVGGIHARKLCFLPASGKAMVKRLASTNTTALAAQDRAARQTHPVRAGSGTVDLF